MSPASPLLPIVATGQDDKQDLIEFFANRGERTKALESEVKRLEGVMNALKQKLEKSELSVASFKVQLLSMQIVLLLAGWQVSMLFWDCAGPQCRTCAGRCHSRTSAEGGS
jgi:hypothetical protein